MVWCGRQFRALVVMQINMIAGCVIALQAEKCQKYTPGGHQMRSFVDSMILALLV